MRSSWSQYFNGTEAVILVIDSCDGPRLGLVKQELMKIVADEVRYWCNFASD